MKYVFLIVLSMIFIISCEKKKDDLRDYTPVPNTIKNDIENEDRLTTSDTTRKRYYKKDAMKVDTFPYFADYKGYRYYFPCGPCRDRFIQEGEEYLEKWIKKGRRIRKKKL